MDPEPVSGCVYLLAEFMLYNSKNKENISLFLNVKSCGQGAVTEFFVYLLCSCCCYRTAITSTAFNDLWVYSDFLPDLKCCGFDFCAVCSRCKLCRI